MRVKVEGKITAERAAQVLFDLMKRAPMDAMITGFNMYLTVRDENDYPVDFLNEEGEPMELLIYREKRHAVPLRPPKRPVKGKPKLKLVQGAKGQTEAEKQQAAA